MGEETLISALSLFAGISLMPAAFLIMRDKEVPLSSDHTLKGNPAITLAFTLLSLGVVFLLNVIAQDLPLFLALIALLVLLPLTIVRIDNWRKSRTR